MIYWKPTKHQCMQVLQNKLALIVTRDYERILIGTPKDILRRLDGHTDNAIFHDETRPFGTFLLSQRADSTWNTALSLLQQAQEILNMPAVARPFLGSAIDLEKQALSHLEEEYDSLDPVCQFVAMRIWYDYWTIRGLKNKDKSEQFIARSHNLVRPFSLINNTTMQRVKVTPQNPIFCNAREIEYCDKISITYTTDTNPSVECLLVDNSIIPLERYYKSQIEKYTKYIIECKSCKKLFMADTLRFELCSDACREQAIIDNNSQRMEDPTTAETEARLANARAHWNNRLRKIKDSPEWTKERIEKFKEEKAKFQKEATDMRQKNKTGEITTKEFYDWLFRQQEKAETVLQELMVTKR